MKTIHRVILQERGVPYSSLTRDLRRIYPLLQSRNLAHPQKIVEVGGISPGKVREIVKLTVPTKKAGRRTYPNEGEESLVIVSADIEGGHGLPLDCRGVTNQLQNVVKAVKYRWGDNDILEKYIEERHW